MPSKASPKNWITSLAADEIKFLLLADIENPATKRQWPVAEYK